MKGAVLKTLKKLSFHHTFDFDFIYPSNNDAVHDIMAALSERLTVTVTDRKKSDGVVVGSHVAGLLSRSGARPSVINLKEQEEEEDVYPFSFYKDKKAEDKVDKVVEMPFDE
jgi:hypothetical protein